MKFCSSAVFLAVVLLASTSATCADVGSMGSQATGLQVPASVDSTLHQVRVVDLLTLREAGGMLGKGLSVSPDGDYLAFELHQADVGNNDYSVAWFVASTEMPGLPVNVGDGGDPILFRSKLPDGQVVGAWRSENAQWSPDGSGFAYRKRVDGETQIWWSSRDGVDTRQLTHNTADVRSLCWNRDGSRIFFDTDADRAQLREAEVLQYRKGEIFDYDTSWSTIDGKPMHPAYSLIGGKPRVWLLDVKSRIERPATNNELTAYEQLKDAEPPSGTIPNARQIARTADRTAIAWVEPDDPDKQGRSPPLTVYAALNADGSGAIRCPASECSGILDLDRTLREGLHWTSVEDEVLFVRKEGVGYSKQTLYGWRVGQDHVRKVFTTDDWVSDCSVVRDRAICFRETPTYPRTIVSIDLKDGTIRELVDPNPEFRSVVLGEVQLLEWQNSEGYETFGYLVKPPDYVPGHRYPLVFVGYRARYALRGGVGDEYPVHVFAANGIVVLVYEKPTPYRALEKYSDPVEIGKAMWGPDMFDGRMSLASFRSAIDLLAEQGIIDRSRVAVTGLSAGVGDVSYALIHSNLFSAAIVSSFEMAPSALFLGGSAGKPIREYRKAIGAEPYGNRKGLIWEQLSLGWNAERISAPLLVNVSDSEHSWALEGVIRLVEAGKPVEMAVYPDEGHIKWQPAHRLSVYERNVDWLKLCLLGIDDPDPRKAAQYARWHRLLGRSADN
jgi:dipeptidyl aminopeptidase/acylaminoacyl peptidase